MIALALTLLVSWICIRALRMPSDEHLQAALLPFAEEPGEHRSSVDDGDLTA